MRPGDDSKEFKEEAGRLFMEDFIAWLAAGREDKWRAEDYQDAIKPDDRLFERIASGQQGGGMAC